MIKWQDFYTSPKLSQWIKEKKGVLPDDHEYWKSPATIGWMDVEDDQSHFLYVHFRSCQSKFNMIHPVPPHSVIEKANPAFIPAYHILQDICIQNHDLFFDDKWVIENITELFCNIDEDDKIQIDKYEIIKIEGILKDWLSPKRFDNKEA